MDSRYPIHLAKTEIREGYNTGDVDRVIAQLAPGYTDLSDGFPSCARDEARDVLRTRLSLLFSRYAVELVSITADILVSEISDAMSVAFGWHELHLTPRDGGPVEQRRTRFVELWQSLDGVPKLALFIDNLDQAPALAAETIAALLSGDLDPLRGRGGSGRAEVD